MGYNYLQAIKTRLRLKGEDRSKRQKNQRAFSGCWKLSSVQRDVEWEDVEGKE